MKQVADLRDWHDTVPYFVWPYINRRTGLTDLKKLKHVLDAKIYINPLMIEKIKDIEPKIDLASHLPNINSYTIVTTESRFKELLRDYEKSKKKPVTSDTNQDSSIAGTRTNEEDLDNQEQNSNRNMVETEMTEEERQRFAEIERKRAEDLQKQIDDFEAKKIKAKTELEVKSTEVNTAKRSYEEYLATYNQDKAAGTITSAKEAMLHNYCESYRKLVLERVRIQTQYDAFSLTDPSASEQEKERNKQSLHQFTPTPSEDAVNKRTADGKLIVLDEGVPTDGYDGSMVAEGVDLVKLKKAWDTIMDVNGKPFYDAEANALGTLTPNYYLYLPQDHPIPICPIEFVGQGLYFFPLTISMLAGVYALAKNQAKALGWDEGKQKKWAILRLEGVKYGWFDGQKYTKYMPTPLDASKIMEEDADYIESNLLRGSTVAGFVPFMNEYYFRNFNSTFTPSNSGDFLRRAKSVAEAMKDPSLLDFCEPEMMFGDSFRWVGVHRQMQVLRLKGDTKYIPEPFKIRVKSAPAGRAVISTSCAVIRSFRACGWWESLSAFGNYDDKIIEEATALLISNPWKYHILSTIYTDEKVTMEEAQLFEKAATTAVALAPIFQAYIETIGKDDDIGAAKVLSKYIKNNRSLYLNAKVLFKKAAKGTISHVTELYKKEMFETNQERMERMKNLRALEGPEQKKKRRIKYIRETEEGDKEMSEEEP